MGLIKSLLNKILYFLLFITLALLLPLTVVINTLQKKQTLLQETIHTSINVNINTQFIDQLLTNTIPSRLQPLLSPLTQTIQNNPHFSLLYATYILLIILFILIVITEDGIFTSKIKKSSLAIFVIALITKRINLILINTITNLIKPYITVSNVLPNIQEIIKDPNKLAEINNTFTNLMQDITKDLINEINITYKFIYGVIIAIFLFTFVLRALPQVEEVEDIDEEEELAEG